jgi:hypothetical protein
VYDVSRTLLTSNRHAGMSTPAGAAMSHADLLERYAASERANESLTKTINMYKERTVNISQLLQKYKALEQTHQELLQQYKQAAAQLGKAQADIDAARAKSSAKASELTPLKGKLRRETAAKEALAAKLKTAEAQQTEVQSELQEQRARAQQLAKERDELTATATDARSLAQSAIEQVQTLRSDVAALNGALPGATPPAAEQPGVASELAALRQQVRELQAGTAAAGARATATQDTSHAASAESDSTALHRVNLSSIQRAVQVLSAQHASMHAEFSRWRALFGALAGGAALGVAGALQPAVDCAMPVDEDAGAAHFLAPLSSCGATGAFPARSSSDVLADSAAAWDVQRSAAVRAPAQGSTAGVAPRQAGVAPRQASAAKRPASHTAARAPGAQHLQPEDALLPPARRRRITAPTAQSGDLDVRADGTALPAQRTAPRERLVPATDAALEARLARDAGAQPHLEQPPPELRIAPAPPLPKRTGRASAHADPAAPRRGQLMQIGSGRVKSTVVNGSGFFFTSSQERALWDRVQQSHIAEPCEPAEGGPGGAPQGRESAALDDLFDAVASDADAAELDAPLPQHPAATAVSDEPPPTRHDHAQDAQPSGAQAASCSLQYWVRDTGAAAAAADTAAVAPPAQPSDARAHALRTADVVRLAPLLTSSLCAAHPAMPLPQSARHAHGSADAQAVAAAASWPAPDVGARLLQLAGTCASEATLAACLDTCAHASSAPAVAAGAASALACSLAAHLQLTGAGCCALDTSELGMLLAVPDDVSAARAFEHMRTFWRACGSQAAVARTMVPPLLAMQSFVICAIAQRAAQSQDAATCSAGSALLAWGHERWGWHSGGCGVGEVLALARALVTTLVDVGAAPADADALAACRQLEALQAALRGSDASAPGGGAGSGEGTSGSSSKDSDSASSESEQGSPRSPCAASGRHGTGGAVQQFAQGVSAALELVAHVCVWQVTAQVLLDSVVWPAMERVGICGGEHAGAVRKHLRELCLLLLQSVESMGKGDAVAAAYVADAHDALEFVT